MSCSVNGCTNCRRFKPEDISFHCFPRSNLLETWLNVLGKDRKSWTWTKNKVVCSKHFSDEDYTVRDGKKSLNVDAIPRVTSNASCVQINKCYKPRRRSEDVSQNITISSSSNSVETRSLLLHASKRKLSSSTSQKRIAYISPGLLSLTPVVVSNGIKNSRIKEEVVVSDVSNITSNNINYVHCLTDRGEITEQSEVDPLRIEELESVSTEIDDTVIGEEPALKKNKVSAENKINESKVEETRLATSDSFASNSNGIMENEFDYFGRCVAVQLKSMPLDRALMCHEKLQKIISDERIYQYRLNNSTK